jgi:hypothetical protein
MNPISVSSLNTSLGGKADAGHNHVIADVTGLQAGLDAKATVTYVNTQLSSLNASNVTTGELSAARLPNKTAWTAGQFLKYNGTTLVTEEVQASGGVTASESFIPDENGTYDLGSSTKAFRNLYLTGGLWSSTDPL